MLLSLYNCHITSASFLQHLLYTGELFPPSLLSRLLHCLPFRNRFITAWRTDDTFIFPPSGPTMMAAPWWWPSLNYTSPKWVASEHDAPALPTPPAAPWATSTLSPLPWGSFMSRTEFHQNEDPWQISYRGWRHHTHKIDIIQYFSNIIEVKLPIYF